MLNDARPIVPPMQNVVGNTHAETRHEIEARARAEQAARQAELAALEQKANKKSPVSTVFAIVFGFLALAAIGFSVYEYLENDKLQAELKDANARYSEADARNTELSETNSKLRQRNSALEEELNSIKNPSEDTDNTNNNTDSTDDADAIDDTKDDSDE